MRTHVYVQVRLVFGTPDTSNERSEVTVPPETDGFHRKRASNTARSERLAGRKVCRNTFQGLKCLKRGCVQSRSSMPDSLCQSRFLATSEQHRSEQHRHGTHFTTHRPNFHAHHPHAGRASYVPLPRG